MKGGKGFVNRAKSGAKAATARVRQAAAKGRIEHARAKPKAAKA